MLESLALTLLKRFVRISVTFPGPVPTLRSSVLAFSVDVVLELSREKKNNGKWKGSTRVGITYIMSEGVAITMPLVVIPDQRVEIGSGIVGSVGDVLSPVRLGTSIEYNGSRRRGHICLLSSC